METVLQLISNLQSHGVDVVASLVSALAVILTAMVAVYMLHLANRKIRDFFLAEDSCTSNQSVWASDRSQGDYYASKGFSYGGAGIWWHTDGRMISGPVEAGEIHHDDGTTEFPHGREDIPDWWREKNGFL